jgi:hypothetical protein
VGKKNSEKEKPKTGMKFISPNEAKSKSKKQLLGPIAKDKGEKPAKESNANYNLLDDSSSEPKTL